MASINSHFTTQIQDLVSRVFERSITNDTLLDQAHCFYTADNSVSAEISALKSQVTELSVKEQSYKKKDQSHALQKKKAEDGLLDLTQKLQSEQRQRQDVLYRLAEEIISICEGDSFEETNRKSAQCLGTIQMLSPTEGSKIAEKNELSKPVYKAIICLRLLDNICINSTITDPYLTQFVKGFSSERFKEFSNLDEYKYQRFVENVKIPLVIAALIQDIGNYNPQARLILVGEDGNKDPFRTLEVDERKKLLQINYRESLRFMLEGVGLRPYTGNSKAERDQFGDDQKRQLAFIKAILKSAIQPKRGMGNLLKVPQIYTSIVLSTKSSYNYKVLPKVFQALNQNAERGACSQTIVDALYQITGMFPQGYGVTYIPSEMGQAGDFYEYAVVTQLYPKDPEHPLCRCATRQLSFVGYGLDIEIAKDRNLYFVETARKLSNISKSRLNEILELLSSNYQERQDLDLLPRCWHTKSYFSIKNNQKLWNKRAN